MARKPLSGTLGSTVLAHGTGALNVDGCRVGDDVTTTIRNGNSGAHGRFGRDTRVFTRENPPGRWPANVVLSHVGGPDGCREVGTRKVKGITGGRPGQKAAGRYGAFEGLDRPVIQYADPDGTETVAAWECHPECPVRRLDEEVGEAGAHPTGPNGRARREYPAIGTFGQMTPDARTPFDHQDTGGPSRFFKTVAWTEEDAWQSPDPASGAGSPSSPTRASGASALGAASPEPRTDRNFPAPSTSDTGNGSGPSGGDGTPPTPNTGQGSLLEPPPTRPTPSVSPASPAAPSAPTGITTTTASLSTSDGSAGPATSPPTSPSGGLGGLGSGSRTFYTAKASSAERDGASHPTIKPLALMRWLVRLVTPPGGLVLDPFAGSGTTGLACREEGFRCVLIEREEEYAAMAAHRLRQLSLFGGAA